MSDEDLLSMAEILDPNDNYDGDAQKLREAFTKETYAT